ncbi:MAG TPA: hypothetical protein VES88_10065 [Gemmatimonadaceae bacterium]|nr:hypothetical protein [Gemmatimonadaceae bacterium]
MTDNKTELSVPAKTRADYALALVRGAISSVPIAGGIGAELFSILVRTPYDRRADEWMREVSERLRKLSEQDESRFRNLLEDEDFASLIISATQIALRTNRTAKVRLLANAVDNSARGVDIPADLQLLFVRFVDELTLTHLAVLRFLLRSADKLEAVDSYEELYGLFLREITDECEREEFRLFCNDLQARMLARFSAGLDDFPGVASSNVIVTDNSGGGPKIVVTELGRRFLRFIELKSATPAV